MHDFSIEMALVDYIPVAFFAIAAFILLVDLKNKMTSFNYLIFSLTNCPLTTVVTFSFFCPCIAVDTANKDVMLVYALLYIFARNGWVIHGNLLN